MCLYRLQILDNTANIVVNGLPDVVRKFDTKLIIIPDMLQLLTSGYEFNDDDGSIVASRRSKVGIAAIGWLML